MPPHLAGNKTNTVCSQNYIGRDINNSNYYFKLKHVGRGLQKSVYMCVFMNFNENNDFDNNEVIKIIYSCTTAVSEV